MTSSPISSPNSSPSVASAVLGMVGPSSLTIGFLPLSFCGCLVLGCRVSIPGGRWSGLFVGWRDQAVVPVEASVDHIATPGLPVDEELQALAAGV